MRGVALNLPRGSGAVLSAYATWFHCLMALLCVMSLPQCLTILHSTINLVRLQFSVLRLAQKLPQSPNSHQAL